MCLLLQSTVTIVIISLGMYVIKKALVTQPLIYSNISLQPGSSPLECLHEKKTARLAGISAREVRSRLAGLARLQPVLHVNTFMILYVFDVLPRSRQSGPARLKPSPAPM